MQSKWKGKWKRAAALGALAAAMALAVQAAPMAGGQLEAHLQQRFEGDRTGACVLAAVVEGGQVARARWCARGAMAPADSAAFELGSVAKTMLAFLVADLIEQRGWSLDDPIARHLPQGTQVPGFDGQEIRIRHLVTHTSGLPVLPPDFAPADARNPYAGLAPAALLRALGRTRLAHAPGAPDAQPVYSNFGMMVLSLAVARAYEGGLEAALRTRLFGPLDMRDAGIGRRDGAAWVPGREPGGGEAPAWTIAADLAGVGMVRASLDDMVK